MANECFSTLTAGILNDCTESRGKGYEPDGWIIARSAIDWDALARTGNIVSAIPIVTGKKAFKVHVPGRTPFTGSTDEIAEFGWGTAITRNISLVMQADSPRNNQTVDELRADSYVLILEKKAKGQVGGADFGKQAFKIFGLEQGLYVTAGTLDTYSDDSFGGWLLTLTESEAETSGIFLFNTDYATTKAALESMLTAA